jgi:hypothetical protein
MNGSPSTTDLNDGLGITPPILAFFHRTWSAWRSGALSHYDKSYKNKAAKPFSEFMNIFGFAAYRSSRFLTESNIGSDEFFISYSPQAGAPGMFAFFLTNRRVWFYNNGTHQEFPLADVRGYKWESALFSVNAPYEVTFRDRKECQWTFILTGAPAPYDMRSGGSALSKIKEFSYSTEELPQMSDLETIGCNLTCPKCDTLVKIKIGETLLQCPACGTACLLCPLCSSPRILSEKSKFEKALAFASGLAMEGLPRGHVGAFAVYQGIEACKGSGSLGRCQDCRHRWKL